ncbi:MAG: DUF1501 domain-containing protein [Planctomycetia bacterium]|nr:DUF1501 domain-containing protein [Planctomycetia bacterium]
MLSQSAMGFGAIALASVLADEGRAAPLEPAAGSSLAARPGHYRGRAKSVIFLYMDGGPSQVDTFDPKPRLAKDDGKPFAAKILPTQFNNNGSTFGSPWKFRQCGQCGTPVSELFPFVARHVDDLAVIRSMTSKFPEHTNANYFLHTGHGQQGRPSFGAWTAYGLGSESQNLPAYVVLNGGLIPPGGLDNFNSGFLPATFQGSVFGHSDPLVANIQPAEKTRGQQLGKLDLMRKLDRERQERLGREREIESAIVNHELAYRMQMAVPELTDLSQETEATRRLYALDSSYEPTAIYGRICLLARRLVERGVRCVQLTCPSVGADRWDQHNDLVTGHTNNAKAVDQPIAGLLTDLQQRGLLDETLVVWSGEFGRTPFAQGTGGRDHNPFGFSLWLAGGGVQGGVVYGATDEFGYHAVENVLEIHDLHATMLHLLGIDHLKLTYRFSGRDIRLTDVHGKIIEPILA